MRERTWREFVDIAASYFFAVSTGIAIPALGLELYRWHQEANDKSSISSEQTELKRVVDLMLALIIERSRAEGRILDPVQVQDPTLRALYERTIASIGGAESPEKKAAAAALSKGDIGPAEQYLLAKAQQYEKVNQLRKASEAHFDRGLLLLTKDPNAAVESFRKATLLAPDDPRCWTCLGAALLRVGELAGAEEASKQALTLTQRAADGDVAFSKRLLGFVLSARGKSDEAIVMLSEAILLLERALAEPSEIAIAYEIRGHDQVKLKRFADAAVSFRFEAGNHAKIGKKREQANALLNAASAALAADSVDAASDDLKTATDIFVTLRDTGGHARALYLAGIAAFNKGQTELARERLEEARRLAIQVKDQELEGRISRALDDLFPRAAAVSDARAAILRMLGSSSDRMIRVTVSKKGHATLVVVGSSAVGETADESITPLPP